MDTPRTVEAGQFNLHEQRAVKAWARLSMPDREPTRVVILKPENKTSSVYRLDGLGPSGSAVIAKRKRIGSMALELTIYREILPHTGLRTLDCYGFTDDPDPGFGWLFSKTRVTRSLISIIRNIVAWPQNGLQCYTVALRVTPGQRTGSPAGD